MTRYLCRVKTSVQCIPYKEVCKPPVKLTRQWKPEPKIARYFLAWDLCPQRFHEPEGIGELIAILAVVQLNMSIGLADLFSKCAYSGDPK